MNGSDTVVTTADVFGRLVATLNYGRVSVGDLASLRRMDPRKPPAAFYKLEGMVLDPILPPRQEYLHDLETRWAAIVLGLVLLGQRHDFSRRFGLALAEANWSEVRFTRLIRADVAQLVDELPALARFFAAKNVRVDWSIAARLILPSTEESAESVRRSIARDFYRVQPGR